MSSENPKERFGKQKPPMGLVPPVAIIATSKVMELGARKYGPWNWREKPVNAMTYLHAAYRHLAAWADGEDMDKESGQSHLAHVLADMAILLDGSERPGTVVDDRPRAGGAAKCLERLGEEEKGTVELYKTACVSEHLKPLQSWVVWRHGKGWMWEAWPHNSMGPGEGWVAMGQSHKPTAKEALEEVREMWRPHT